jgi:hypothetical protein
MFSLFSHEGEKERETSSRPLQKVAEALRVGFCLVASWLAGSISHRHRLIDGARAGGAGTGRPMHAHASAARGQDRETRELLLLPYLRDADSFQFNFADSGCGTARSPLLFHGTMTCGHPETRGTQPGHATGGRSNSNVRVLSPRGRTGGDRVHSLAPIHSLGHEAEARNSTRFVAHPLRFSYFGRRPLGGCDDLAREIRVTSTGSMSVPLPWTQHVCTTSSGPVAN